MTSYSQSNTQQTQNNQSNPASVRPWWSTDKQEAAEHRAAKSEQLLMPSKWEKKPKNNQPSSGNDAHPGSESEDDSGEYSSSTYNYSSYSYYEPVPKATPLDVCPGKVGRYATRNKRKAALREEGWIKYQERQSRREDEWL